MAPRLKVFATQIGLKTWVVAATSRKAALKAWDVRDNLFASGAAVETNDPAAVEAALKQPGVPVAVKTLRVSEALAAKDPPKPRVRHPLAPAASVVRLADHRARVEAPAPKPKPDRARLDAAEAALAAFAREARARRAELAKKQRAFETEIARRRASLEDEIAAAEARLVAEERGLIARRDREKAAFERAGGAD